MRIASRFGRRALGEACLCGFATLAVAACGQGVERGAAGQVSGVYGREDRLVRLNYDADADGRVDTWTYMDGQRVRRAETDTDSDGIVDRWEYYSASGEIERIGSSSAHDGREDTWLIPNQPGGTTRIEPSTRRDGIVSRRESFEADLPSTVEEDTDGDGRIDRWEAYQDGVIAMLALDTSGQGWPDRRLVYDATGQLVRIEIDADGDGVFVPHAPPP